MNPQKPLFVLAGNGPYDNRGCEAIVRGTIEILRHYYDNPSFVVFSFFKSNSQFERQRESENDKSILHERLTIRQMRLGLKRLLLYGRPGVFLLSLRNYPNYRKMLNYLNKSYAVLSVGGDNYSLDYGIPKRFTALDDLVLAKKRPIIIWGASVGPFSLMPEYESYMIEHLKKITGIFAREPSTIGYLNDKGVNKNVYRVADPAFLMKPDRPPKYKFTLDIPNGAIGINLSRLMAKFISKGNIENWMSLAIRIVEEISIRTKRPIFLIPHVTNPDSNDYVFLKDILTKMERGRENINLVPENLNAAETKWVISKMAVFAGARTHSTIAAISAGIPTLSFAYSIKAKGINQDTYGHGRYCLDPMQLEPRFVADKVEELNLKSGEIKKQIQLALLNINQLAMDGGMYLKELLSECDTGSRGSESSLQ